MSIPRASAAKDSLQKNLATEPKAHKASSIKHNHELGITNGVAFRLYEDERQLPRMMALCDKDLSEPYSIFTYRYFLTGWPELCILAYNQEQNMVGVIVGKAETEGPEPKVLRGYIAMLAVDRSYRRAGIGATLVRQIVERMVKLKCNDVVLETEVTNSAALALYGRLGFAREERLLRYYLNGVDAYRLKLWLTHQRKLDIEALTLQLEEDERREQEDQELHTHQHGASKESCCNAGTADQLQACLRLDDEGTADKVSRASRKAPR